MIILFGVIAGVTAVSGLLTYALCKVASDADDALGYDELVGSGDMGAWAVGGRWPQEALDRYGERLFVGDQVLIHLDDTHTLTVVRIGQLDGKVDVRVEGYGTGDGVWCRPDDLCKVG